MYDFENEHFLKHIIIIEKTNKETRIAINDNIKQGLGMYMESLYNIRKCDYIFNGQKKVSHWAVHRLLELLRKQLMNFIWKGISCHSMRKTFGYYAWKCGTPPAILMDIYNHSSYEITRRYLGIKQDDKDSVFLNINL